MTSTRLARFGCPTSLLLLAFLAGCGADADPCFDDRSCGLNMRCNKPKFGDPGTCEACGTEEISYDGIDNDCSPRTPDLDLDGDGDNWVSAPIRPGSDCDDQDPTVRPGLPELCADQTDNDCDQKVDEKDCGDREPPTVSIRMPIDGQLVVGGFSVVVDASDDVGLTEIAVNVNGVEQRRMTLGEVTIVSPTIELNSENLTDSKSILEVVVTDVAGGTAKDSVSVDIDNRTSPAVVLARPNEGRAYGGSMNISAQVSDPSGIAAVEMSIDGNTVRTFTSSATEETFSYVLDTTTLAEGPHTFRVVATEGRPQGPLTTTQNVTFSIDNTAPTVDIVSPIDRATVMGSVPFRIEASDASGILAINFAGASGGAPFEGAIDTLSMPNGDQSLTAIAYDNVEVDGGAGHSATDEVDIRIMNPNGGAIVTITNLADGDSVVGRAQVDYSATAPLDGTINFVDVSIDDVIVHRGLSVRLPPIDVGRIARPIRLTVRVYNQLNQASASIDLNVVAPLQLVSASCYGAGNDRGFAVEDVTGDGVLDVVHAGEDLNILEGEIVADGRWAARRVLGFPVLSPLSTMRSAHVGSTTGPAGAREIVTLELGSTTIHRFRYVAGATPTTYPTLQPIGSAAPMPSGVTTFAMGDVDGDEDLDVVVSGGGLFALSRFDNGGFETATPILGPPTIQYVTLVDVDDDADLDILGSTILSGGTTASVILMLNDGTGVYGIPTQIAIPANVGNPTSRVAVGDANEDGAVDLLGASAGGAYLMTGTLGSPGAFTFSSSIEFISALGQGTDASLLDLDNDGRPEWILGGIANGFEIWSNPASASPLPVAGFPMGRNMLRQELADMNADGNLDVVAFDGDRDEICVSFGLGGMDFYGPRFKEVRNLRSVAVADVEGSFEPEILVGWDDNNQPLTTSIRVFSRSGNAYGETNSIPLGGSPTSLLIGELDGAFGLDIVAGAIGNAQLLLHQGGSSYARMAVGGLSAGGEFVAYGDPDGNGTRDLVTTYNSGVDGFRYWSLPDAIMVGEVTGGSDPTGVLVGNFDSDAAGTDDVLLYGLSTSALSVWNGSNFVTTLLAGIGGSAVVSRDLNDDGRTDLIYASGMNGLTILYGSAQTVFQAPVTIPVGLSLATVGIVDANSDGLDDVVAMSFSGDLFVFVKGAGGGFLNPTRVMGVAQPFQMAIDDVDGDGTSDVVVGNRVSGFTVAHQRGF